MIYNIIKSLFKGKEVEEFTNKAKADVNWAILSTIIEAFIIFMLLGLIVGVNILIIHFIVGG